MKFATSITRQMRGLTLIELMVSLGVLAILAAIAMPSYTGFMDRYRLEGAVQGLYADLQFARSESVKCNRRVRVAFTFTTPTAWTYTISRIGSCTTSSTTAIDLKTVSFADFPGTQITGMVITATTPVNITTLFFEPNFGNIEYSSSSTGTSGTVLSSNEAQVSFQSGQGRVARVLVNPIGRVRYCSPSGTTNLIGVPTC